MSEPIENPNPEVVTGNYDKLYFPLLIPSEPNGLVKVTQVPMDIATGEVNHKSPEKKSIAVPFSELGAKDENGDYVLPKSAAALNYLKDNALEIIEELENYLLKDSEDEI